MDVVLGFFLKEGSNLFPFKLSNPIAPEILQ